MIIETKAGDHTSLLHLARWVGVLCQPDREGTEVGLEQAPGLEEMQEWMVVLLHSDI